MCLHKHANMGCKGQRLADVMWWMSFQDTRQVVEVYKSGFDPPGDVEFEDYSATMRRSISESSYLDNRTEERRQSRKLWPFIRKTKVYAHTHTQGADETHLEESPGCTQVLFSPFSCWPSCPPPASLHPHPQPLLHPGAWPTVPSPHPQPQPPENQSHSGWMTSWPLATEPGSSVCAASREGYKMYCILYYMKYYVIS